MTLKRKNHVIM